MKRGGKPDAERCAWRQGTLSPDQESAESISADSGRVGEADAQGGHAWVWPPVHVLPRRFPLRLSALRVPDAGPDDPYPPPYLRQPLHDHDDHAVCAPIAGALGVGDALFSDYSVWLQIDHMRICGNLW